VFSSNHLSRRTFPAVHEALRGFRPDVIYAYPSVADQLVRHAEALGCRLRCPLVLTSSEALPANLRRRVANGLGAQVVDIYGQAERVAFAYSVEPDVYRFVPAYSLVELVPGPSEGEFEIVGTPFHNAAQVFVRYATGDRIELDGRAPDLRRLCEGAATFRGISGRLNDVLYGPGGEVFVGIDHIPRGLTDVGRFQFIQEAPDFIRVLVDGTESPGQAATVLQRARMKLPTAMRVEIEFVPELQRTEAGKVPFVIHNHRPAGPPTPT
jgi:phenylacetate-CoA ligase